jgi:Protein of unknown function (DUF3830)
MMQQIRITIGDLILTGTLEDERAPHTCAAFVALLPVPAKLLQARWSGQSAYVPLEDLHIRLDPENEMHRPSPGQVLFYPDGMSPAEILLPYGVTAFACKSGPLSGNHFLTISDTNGLREMGRRVVWDGAQDITFDIVPDAAAR